MASAAQKAEKNELWTGFISLIRSVVTSLLAKGALTRRTIQSVVAILVTLAISAVGLPAQAANRGGVATPASADHDATALADGEVEREAARLQQEFEQADEGQTIVETTAAGYVVTIVKVDGKPVVQAIPIPSEEGVVSAASWMQSFCIATVSAAILGIGAAGMALLAASGGGVVAGIAISGRVAAQASAVLAGGGSIEALIGEFIC